MRRSRRYRSTASATQRSSIMALSRRKPSARFSKSGPDQCVFHPSTVGSVMPSIRGLRDPTIQRTGCSGIVESQVSAKA